MEPSFALSLSFEGISLLHRQGAAWQSLGEIALDTPDLETQIGALRSKAQSLSADGHRVTLIIPNEQIKYLDVADSPGSAEDRQAAIVAALDGATPYAVADLSFDHSVIGPRLLIAAVARETLTEAETFARSHGFDPLSHVAIAPVGAFAGAVDFGPAQGSTQPVSRLSQAITILEGIVPERAIAVPAAQSAPLSRQADMHAPEPDQVQDVSSAAAPETVPPVATDTNTLSAMPAAPAVPETPQKTAVTAEPEPTVKLTADAKTAQPAPPLSETAPEPFAKPTFSTIRASRSELPPKAGALAALSSGRSLDPSASLSAGPSTAAERSGARFTPVLSKEDTIKGAGITDDRLIAETEPEDTAGKGGFFSRRKAAVTGADKNADSVKVAPVLSAPKPAVSTPPAGAARITPTAPATTTSPVIAAAAPAPVVPAPLVPAPDPAPAAPKPVLARKAEPAIAQPAALGATAPATDKQDNATALSRLAAIKARALRGDNDGDMALAGGSVATSERDRMTVFGARAKQNVGGKPRFLGLMLTAALLVLLAGVAAWASVFKDQGLARFFGPKAETSDTQIAGGPVSEGALIALPPQVGSFGDGTEQDADVQLAALETGTETDAGPDLAIPLTAPTLTPEEAEATYAATGIWQLAPTAPDAPATGHVDDIYVASIDESVRQFDAVALPDPGKMSLELVLRDPGLPPGPGVRFALDERGLVRATPEGTLTPDGVRVFAGLPPLVPPLRGIAEQPAPGDVADGSQDGNAAQSALALFRPNPRPTDLIEQKERADLAGRTLAELEKLRPAARPRTVQEEAAEAEPEAKATAQAVAKSLQPVTRPRNITAIVQRAEQERASQPAVVQTAAVAQSVVKPKVATGTSVATQATVRNAINLSKVNLIGVYGTPSNRRALVRLSNGSYKKVKVGDRVDGGRVQAIGEAELRYVKGGRNLVLKMPRT